MNIKTGVKVRVVDNGGTYLMNDSLLDVSIYDGELWVREQYEQGYPCDHRVDDLIADGVRMEFKQ